MSDTPERVNGLPAGTSADDSAAWGVLLDSHSERLRRMVTFRLNPRLRGRVDPADVVQEALAAAVERREDYSRLGGQVSPYVWLRGVVANKLLEVHRFHLDARMRDVGREVVGGAPRGAGADDTSVALFDALTGDETGPGTRLADAEAAGRVRAALASMSPSDREVIRLVDATGALVMGNDDNGDRNAGSIYLPKESPLPTVDAPADDNAELYHVINRRGTYYVEITASADPAPGGAAGRYDLELLVARPRLEGERVGTKQILYVDFDGATVDLEDWTVVEFEGIERLTLTPLADSLESWGLTRADEDAVIDAAMAKINDKLRNTVRRNGANGDYDRTGRPGDFAIELRNSRDHRDTFGRNPFVSRVVVGGCPEVAELVTGASQYDDVGNVVTDDDAIATLDGVAPAIEFIPIPREQVIDFAATFIAVVVVHEAGHNFGCNHTDQDPNQDGDIFSGAPDVMDPDIRTSIGPDFVWGSEDDRDVQFGVDDYLLTEPFRGVNDTLNTVAFGLSTGTGRGRWPGDGPHHRADRAGGGRPDGVTDLLR